MSLDSEQVRQVAHLARLAVPAEQLDPYARQLSGILEMVDQLQKTDTDAVAPMAHPLDTAQRLRPDAVTESDRRAAFQAIAPACEGGLYIVPKVIE